MVFISKAPEKMNTRIYRAIFKYSVRLIYVEFAAEMKKLAREDRAARQMRKKPAALAQ